MSTHRLHALWQNSAGLVLWVEKIQGHQVVPLESVPDGVFPPQVMAALSGRKFTHSVSATLQTPKGRRVSLTMPACALAPAQAVEVLDQLAALELPHTVGLNPEQKNTLAPDLWWFIRLYRSLVAHARAGRVLIRCRWSDAQWLPQFYLAPGPAETQWLGDMTAAAPGIIVVNGGPEVAEDCAGELVHAICLRLLQPWLETRAGWKLHDFTQALVQGEAFHRGSSALVSALHDWARSATLTEVDLVVVVAEPEEETQWEIEVLVSVAAMAPQPPSQVNLDPEGMERVRVAYDKLVSLAPALQVSARSRDSLEWGTTLSTEELVEFIDHTVPRLKMAGIQVLLPKSWATAELSARLQVRPKGDPATAATVTRLGFEQIMDYDWKISLGDQDLDAAEMEQLVRASTRLVKIRGNWVLANAAQLRKVQNYVHALAHTAAHSPAEASGEVTLAELREFQLEQAPTEPVAIESSDWRAALVGGPGTVSPERVEVPATVHAELRHYQQRGVDWLVWMSRNGIGAVLADDMGLGKTLQVLSMIEVERAAAPEGVPVSLVICPTTLVGNWVREAARFVPTVKVHSHYGADRLHGQELQDAATAAHLVITTYGVATRDAAELAQLGWDHVILDEAQAIKNSGTKQSRAVRSIPARQRIALTGTPVENRVSELRSIIDFCNPGILGSTSFFRNHFAKAIERAEDEEMAERLRQLTAPFILRRLKTDPAIVADLPEKSEHLVSATLSAEQASLYRATTEGLAERLKEKGPMKKRGMVLATITALKQICNHPAHYLGDGSAMLRKGRHRSGKVEAMSQLVLDALSADGRVLVFTQYAAFGHMLRDYLQDLIGVEVPFLHGQTPKAQRDKMVVDFQRAAGPPVMVLSLKAGGTGLTLTRANTVIHMDRWWNPAVENQATDRAFRIGQNRQVQVYKMVTAGTIEERIEEILHGKMQLAGNIVGAGESWITEMDPEDLEELVALGEFLPKEGE